MSSNGSQSQHGSLCTFFLGARHFGLDVSLVGEVVTLERISPVPASPAAVRGIFNLRGTPVALLDLSVVLDLEAAKGEGAATTALVLRVDSTRSLANDELLLGLVIDRMEAVSGADRGAFVERGAEDHPAVRGFLELGGEKKEVVTVLEPAVLLERLEATRLSRVED